MRRSLLTAVTVIITLVFSFDAEGRLFSEIGSSFSGVGSRIKAKVDNIRGIAPYIRDLKNLQSSLSDFGNATRSAVNEFNKTQEQFIMSCNAFLTLALNYCQTAYGLVTTLINSDSTFKKATAALDKATTPAKQEAASSQQQLATDSISNVINSLIGPDMQMMRYLLKFSNVMIIKMMEMGVYPSGDPTNAQRRIDVLSQKGSGIVTASRTFSVGVENIMNEVNITQMSTMSGEPLDSQAILNKVADVIDTLQFQISFINELKSYLAAGGRSITEQKAQELYARLELNYNSNLYQADNGMIEDNDDAQGFGQDDEQFDSYGNSNMNYGQRNNSRMMSGNSRNTYNSNSSYGEDENYGQRNNSRMMSGNSRNTYNSNNSYGEDEDFEQGNVSNNMSGGINRARSNMTGRRTNNTGGSSIAAVKRGRIGSNNSAGGSIRRAKQNGRILQGNN